MKRKKRTKAETPRPGTVRVSAPFYGVVRTITGGVVKMQPGTDLWPTIQLATGRGGADIKRSTIDAWEAAGLVRIETRKPNENEHHLLRPIVAVRITRAGIARVDERHERELARSRPAA